MNSLEGPPIDIAALNELLEELNITRQEFGMEAGLSKSYTSAMLSGRRAHPRMETRKKLRELLLTQWGVDPKRVDQIVPDHQVEPKDFLLFIRGGKETRAATRLLKMAAADHLMTIKGYAIACFEEAQPSDPLTIIRAAQAQARRLGLSLEEWVTRWQESEEASA